MPRAANLLHSEEISVHADAGYLGSETREEVQGKKLDCIAANPGRTQKQPERPQRDAPRAEEGTGAGNR